jgi:hypothetical protein
MFASVAKPPKDPPSLPPVSAGSNDKKQKLIQGFIEDNERLLSEIRQFKTEGKSLDSAEISKAIQKIASGLGGVMSTGLKLSEKFQLGNRLCAEVCKEGSLLDDMIALCVDNRKKLPRISKPEANVWEFFMNGTIFSSDLSMKLSAAKDLLSYAKDALESLYDVYIAKKANVSLFICCL